jgi:hypothetical protein
MAGIRSFRREPGPQGVKELLRLGRTPAHPNQAFRGPIFVIDATLASPQPTVLHRGDKLLQLCDLSLHDGVEHARLRHIGGMRGTCPRLDVAAAGNGRDTRSRDPHRFARLEARLG